MQSSEQKLAQTFVGSLEANASLEHNHELTKLHAKLNFCKLIMAQKSFWVKNVH